MTSDAQWLDGSPLVYAAAHAPAGGVTIGGKQFAGGQFIPSEVMDAATPEEKAAVEGGPGPAAPQAKSLLQGQALEVAEKYKNEQMWREPMREYMEAQGLTIEDYDQANALLYSHNISSGGEADAAIMSAWHDPKSRVGHALRAMADLNEWQVIHGPKYPDPDLDLDGIRARLEKMDLGTIKFMMQGGSVVQSKEDMLRLLEAKKRGDTIFYRKGPLDKDVISTTTDPQGARSGSSYFRPDRYFLIDDMHRQGYRLVAGQRGMIGVTAAQEQENVWIKVGQPADPNDPRINYEWREEDHPRDDHGRFIDKDELEWAKSDPKIADELREAVNDPDERAKLERLIGASITLEPTKAPSSNAPDGPSADPLADTPLAGKLPQTATERLRAGRLTKVRHLDSVDAVTAAWNEGGEPSKTPVLAFYDPSDGVLTAGPGDSAGLDMRGVLAHELGHALDQSDDRKHFDLSGHPDFVAAWKAEIDVDGAPLSNYARYDEVEGFAELCRLIYGTDDGAATARDKFPKCYAYFESVGLVEPAPVKPKTKPKAKKANVDEVKKTLDQLRKGAFDFGNADRFGEQLNQLSKAEVGDVLRHMNFTPDGTKKAMIGHVVRTLKDVWMSKLRVHTITHPNEPFVWDTPPVVE